MIFIGRIDLISDADDPDVLIDGETHELHARGLISKKPAGVLNDNKIPKAFVNPLAGFVNARPEYEFAQRLGIAQHREFGIGDSHGCQEPLTKGNLVFNGSRVLFFGAVASINEDSTPPTSG